MFCCTSPRENRHCGPWLRLMRLAIASLAVCLTSATTVTQAQVVQVHSLQVGLASHGQPGRWLPIKLQASGLAAGETVHLTVSAPDPRGDLSESTFAEQVVAADGTVELEGVFMSGRLESSIQLGLRNAAGNMIWQHEITSAEASADNDRQLPPKTASLPQQLLMNRQTPVTLLCVGKQAGLAELSAMYSADRGTRDLLRVLSLDSMLQLPAMPRGLDSIDVLLLNGDWTINEAQGAAIREWVLAGGHLVTSCGAEADALLRSPVGHWIQPKFDIPETGNTLQTFDLTAIQNFVLGAVALQTNRNPVTVLRMPSQQPKVLVQSISDPLISRTAAGAGVITLVAVNLNNRPLDKWLSLPQLYETLLFGGPQSARSDQARSGGRIASVGITDLSTQLAAVSDAVPDGQRWSTWHVMLLMVALLVFVGPFDYFLVVRLFKAPRLTWITLPLFIAAGCLFAIRGLSTQYSDFTTRQVGLLDVFEDAGEQRFRARTWSSLSARESRYAHTSTQDAVWIRETAGDSGERSLMWSGRIENIFGGMYRPGGAGLGQLVCQHIEKQHGPEFTALPLLADGSTAFLTDRRGSARNGRTLIRSSLRLSANALLEGAFSHQLPTSITNWVVICGNRIYSPSDRAEDQLRELKPGELWSRETGGIRVVEIRDFLRGVRLAATPNENTSRSRTTASQPQQAWDVSSRNALDILLMASLYEAAGGRSFVQLRNDALRRDELSDTIGLNHALLMGILKDPLAALQVDDQPIVAEDSVTVVRLLLPVERIIQDTPQAETSITPPAAM